jgi:hypothetical protein
MRYVEHFEQYGTTLFERVCKMDLEGIVAKPRTWQWCFATVPPRLLLGGSHRLHRNGISVGCARDFGLLRSKLAEAVQRGLIRGVKGIDFVADYQSVLSAFLHAGTNAVCGGEAPSMCLAPHMASLTFPVSLGAASGHARHDSQSGAQHHRRHPNLQHLQTRHKSSSCSPLCYWICPYRNTDLFLTSK